ncbi:hypothetical protein ACFOON_10580 [Novosphingobium piscinae]|uniref:hypothetical protein n=2 Tax=Novosphingobium piscinae TaxID=1507448 RepID=UPI00361E70B6
MRLFRPVWPVAAVALLAACGGPAPVRGPGSAPPPRPGKPVRPAPRPPQRYVPPPPQIQALPGVAGVIGAGATELARQFGPPRLDVWEGDARKLQFVGPACVLDVFLYPPASGREPQATYVDARRASDGQEVDRAACIAALRQTPGASGVTRP